MALQSESQRASQSPIVHEGHDGGVLSVAFSPDGKSVASTSDGGISRIWDAFSLSPIGEPLRGHTSSGLSVSYSPLGDVLASGSRNSLSQIFSRWYSACFWRLTGQDDTCVGCSTWSDNHRTTRGTYWINLVRCFLS
ncbi:hypothetical protein B0J17DRAFT_41434 [Rhizoctonia solani]|nr:hypothetical protein B0J17DRAFT_41434 [Rhizoctonia solani]